MDVDTTFVDRLHAQSTLAELPSYAHSLELSARGHDLSTLLESDPELPGVVVTERGGVRGVISRGQFQRLVSRQFGLEVYLPRELRLMWKAVDASEEPLVMPTSTPIQQAVSAALERPRALIYEPLIVSRAERDLCLIDFPDLLRADSRLSQLRNRQMHQILTTVREGFLLVDQDHRIAAEYSRSIEQLFERHDIAGHTLPELLMTVIGAQKAALAGQYLDTLFNPNVIEHLVQQINPLIQVVAETPSAIKHLAFRFVRGVERGEIRRVLVRVEDVTQQVELADEVEAQQQLADEKVALVFDIMRADPRLLGGFLGRLDQLLHSAADLLGARGTAMPAHDRLRALFRDLHALKGEAGVLGTALFQREAHRLEGKILELQGQSAIRAEELAGLGSDLESLRELLREATAIVEQFRQLGTHVVPARGARSAGASPAHLAAAKPQPSSPTTPASSTPPASPTFFQAVAQTIAEIATRHQKRASFHTEARWADIPEPFRDLTRDVVTQCARNSVVHGIETPEERRRLGKPEVGVLQFAARTHADSGRLELIFQDDGRGLDVEALRRRAHDLGWHADDEQLPMLIFEPGFSTFLPSASIDASMDAGRGVGMDLLRARVEDLGGRIRPHFTPGVFCAIQVVVPLISEPQLLEPRLLQKQPTEDP